MKIEIYQQGRLVADINLSNAHPVELALISNRLLIEDVKDHRLARIREGEIISIMDDRSRP